jgi:tetratricopeptide (TPR) repeat protein
LSQADKALPPLQRAFAENPKSELIALRLARLLESLNGISDAIDVIRKVLEFNPGKQSLHYALAQLLIRSQPDAATAQGASLLYHLERSFTMGDGNHEAQFWYARQLCLGGEFEKAKPIFATLRFLSIPYDQKHAPRGLVLAADGLPATLYGQVRHRALDHGFIRSDAGGIDVYFRLLKNIDSKDAFAAGARVTFNLAFTLAGPLAQGLAPVT